MYSLFMRLTVHKMMNISVYTIRNHFTILVYFVFFFLQMDVPTYILILELIVK